MVTKDICYFRALTEMKDEGKMTEYKEQLNALTKMELVFYIFYVVSLGAIAEEVMEDYVSPFFFEREARKDFTIRAGYPLEGEEEEAKAG